MHIQRVPCRGDQHQLFLFFLPGRTRQCAALGNGRRLEMRKGLVKYAALPKFIPFQLVRVGVLRAGYQCCIPFKFVQPTLKLFVYQVQRLFVGHVEVVPLL